MTVTDVTIQTIKAFCNLEPKAQALKPLEEAAETFAEWQKYNSCTDMCGIRRPCEQVPRAVPVSRIAHGRDRRLHPIVREPRRDGRRERLDSVYGELRGAQQGAWSLW